MSEGSEPSRLFIHKLVRGFDWVIRNIPRAVHTQPVLRHAGEVFDWFRHPADIHDLFANTFLSTTGIDLAGDFSLASLRWVKHGHDGCRVDDGGGETSLVDPETQI